MKIIISLLCLCGVVFGGIIEIPNSNPSAKITWAKNSNNTYKVSLGLESKKYTQFFETKELFKVVEGLQFDTVYYVTVQAVNEYGLISDPCPEILFKLTKQVENKYVVVLTSKDGGATWLKIGEVLIPQPITKGQRYKTQTITRKE